MRKDKKSINVFLIVGIVFGLLGGISAIVVYNYNQNKEVQIDCSKEFSIFYLKPEELKYSSKILKYNQAVVISIDEDNNVQVNARTESLECPNFDLDYYLGNSNKLIEMFNK